MNNQIVILLLGLLSVGMILGGSALCDARCMLEDEMERMEMAEDHDERY